VLVCVTSVSFVLASSAYHIRATINLNRFPLVRTSSLFKICKIITINVFRLVAYSQLGIECLPLRTFHLYFASISAHVITVAVYVISLRVALAVALPVRPANRRQQTLPSGRFVVLTAGLERPHAVEGFGVEVGRGRAASADGSPAAVTLDVVVAVGGVREVVRDVFLRILWTYWFRSWRTRRL
jgi:hypothetical protein